MSVLAQNVSFSYGSLPVLKGVSFAVEGGRLVSVLGPNGAGKSTLLKCMMGLLKGFIGDIYLEGRDVRSQDIRALSKLAAYIPQAHAPVFHYSVLDIVLMGTTAHFPLLASPGKREREAALLALEKLGMEAYVGRDYARISGGERQLVLIARALAQQSRVLLMDEPTANLDYGNQARVLTRLRALAEEGYTILQTTHNPDLAGMYAHSILAMAGGRVIAQGTPRELLTGELLRALYGMEVRVESLYGGSIRVCVPGEIPPRGQINTVGDETHGP